MNERKTYVGRQRFSFLCPENRTVEARILLLQIDKVRLVPPRRGIQDVRVTPWGIQKGVNIRGIASSEETFIEVLHALADAGIAGYSRETQIIEEPKIKDKRSSETTIKYDEGKLTVKHKWGKGEKSPDAPFVYNTTFISLAGTDLSPVIEMLYIKNRYQFLKILGELQRFRNNSVDLGERVVLDWTISCLEEIAEHYAKKNNELGKGEH